MTTTSFPVRSRLPMIETNGLHSFKSSALAVFLIASAIVLFVPPVHEAAIDLVAGSISRVTGAGDETPQSVQLVPACRPMMDAIKHATALESRGEFGPATREAWTQVAIECEALSRQPIATTHGKEIRLWMQEAEEERALVLAEQIETLVPAASCALRDGTFDLDVFAAVAADVPADVRDHAESLCQLHDEAVENARLIGQYRDVVNFNYWQAACSPEVVEPTLRAREAAWRAEHECADDPAAVKAAYEESFAAWRKALDTSRVIHDDELIAEDIVEMIGRYEQVLEQLGEPLPATFQLRDIVNRTTPADASGWTG
jgi:hypothetical protein